MNKNFHNIMVDAGLILISDKNFYEENGGEIDYSICKKFNIKKGKYKVQWIMPKTWNGTIVGNGILNVDSVEVIVSDPCYNFQDKSDGLWLKILNQTYYFKNPPYGCLVLDKMVGDGNYNIRLNLEPLE